MRDPRQTHEPDPDAGRPSKTRRKQAMLDLQDLGKRLVALDDRRLAQLQLPERLVDALVAVRSIKAHEGRRRQMQYIGRLMREIDAAPVAAALARFDEGPRIAKARFATLEHWRDRILGSDDGLADYLVRHPDAPREELAALAREARAERAAGRAPRRFRELFRKLDTLEPGGDAPASAGAPGHGADATDDDNADD